MADAKALKAKEDPHKLQPMPVGEADLADDEVPVHWDENFDMVNCAQRRDPSHKYRGIKLSATNWQQKYNKGWRPVEGKELIVKLGLGHLRNTNQRAQQGDLELWRMPMARAKAIRAKMDSKNARRVSAVRESLEAQMAETRGRSKGKVDPFMGHPQPTSADVLDRTPLQTITKKE